MTAQGARDQRLIDQGSKLLPNRRMEAMQKKTRAKGRATRGTTGRKLLDLPVKTVRGGDDAVIKGGLPSANKRL
jgi:hypothetical protein